MVANCSENIVISVSHTWRLEVVVVDCVFGCFSCGLSITILKNFAAYISVKILDILHSQSMATTVYEVENYGSCLLHVEL